MTHMMFAIGDRVHVRSKGVDGTVSEYMLHTRTGYETLRDPTGYDGEWPMAYQVEYDEPIWHGDVLRGHERTIRRGIHSGDALDPPRRRHAPDHTDETEKG